MRSSESGVCSIELENLDQETWLAKGAGRVGTGHKSSMSGTIMASSDSGPLCPPTVDGFEFDVTVAKLELQM